ncbi:helix-turn-helix domain-containing protein [Glycomyces halotolerans]
MSERFERVTVVLFDGGAMFEAAVPISVFGARRRTWPRFDLRVAAETDTVSTTAGVTLTAPHGLEAVGDAEVVIVPTYPEDLDREPSGKVLDALRAAHEAGAVVVGLCLGAFVLAAAGLLDGRRATTHWHRAPLLAERFPAVRVLEHELYVDEGDVLTSAGSAAGIDLCLHLIRRSFGADAAADLARAMVVPPHRSGGQAQYIDRPVPAVDRADPLAEALDWALANLDRPLSVDDLAARAAMSRRSFDRHFKAATGTTPTQWLLHHRLAHAQRLLETTDLPVEQVARRSGFASAVALRPHFRDRFHTSPSGYRAAFTGWRESIDS